MASHNTSPNGKPGAPQTPRDADPGVETDKTSGQMDDNIDDRGRKPDGTELDQPGAEGAENE